ncbi:MAG: outer membrane protein assembly factor BamC [Pseudomonadota bacterium]
MAAPQASNMVDCALDLIIFQRFIMKKNPLIAALVASTFLVLAGCSSTGDQSPKPAGDNPKKIGEVEDSIFDGAPRQRKSKTLVLPPDLISSTNSTITANNDEGKREDAVLPTVIGTEIVRSGDRSWLAVDADAEVVWKTIAEFWALHKISLVESNPNIGLMETDWFDLESKRSREEGNRGIIKDLFNRVVGSGAVFDKYRVRLERAGSGKTHVFISHNATAKQESQNESPAKLVEFEWVAKDSDPEKVAIMLRQMALLFEESQSV